MLFSFASVSPAAAACTSSGSPVVTTDKIDYGAFETATISGSGFDCGEVLSVLVTAPDGSTLSGDGMGSAGPDSVTTDENGAFVLSYHLSGTLPGGGTYTGQLGTYTADVMNSSGDVLASTTFTDGGGAYHSCAVTTSGGIKCWGANFYGQLGDGTVTDSATPVDVSELTSGVAQISTGGLHSCAVTTSGGAKCWGYNGNGALGDGTVTDSATPVDVSGLTSGVAQISAGQLHSCVLTTSGGAKCWGYNGYGTLGDGTFTDSATPVDVSGLTSGVALLPEIVGNIVIFNFTGFFQPVDNLPTLNSVKAGQAIPVKFSLGGDQGLNIFAAGYPVSVQIACSSTALVDGIENTVTAGSSSLTYDPLTDQYTYVWKTQKSWANTCRQLVVKFSDGTTQRANFQFK